MTPDMTGDILPHHLNLFTLKGCPDCPPATPGNNKFVLYNGAFHVKGCKHLLPLPEPQEKENTDNDAR